MMNLSATLETVADVDTVFLTPYVLAWCRITYNRDV